MNTIIQNIEELKTTVKINANMPFEAIKPYIADAADIYLTPFLGEPFMRFVDENPSDPAIGRLLPYLRRALGPLSVMLYTHEGSIHIGDSGHTVQKGERFSPASDTKIAQVIESLAFRGYQALDRMLDYLYAHSADYPEWSPPARDHYLNSPAEYQEIGCVDIAYSRLTFEKLKPVMAMIEFRDLREMMPPELDTKLRRALYSDTADELEKELILLSRKYIASRSAAVLTGEKSREQRSASGTPEYRPLIRPLYRDTGDNGNFFLQESDYLRMRITGYIRDNAASLGIKPADTALNYNDKGNKIFVDCG